MQKTLLAISLILPIALLGMPAPSFANSATTGGAKVFEDQCADCHSVEAGKHKRGPSLAGLLGRPAGKAVNYHYSDAMAASGIVWSPARLTQYLAAPKTDLPGTKMRLLSKPSPTEVAELITWLQQAK